MASSEFSDTSLEEQETICKTTYVHGAEGGMAEPSTLEFKKMECDSKVKEGARGLNPGTCGVESQSEEFRIFLEKEGVLQIFECAIKGQLPNKPKREHLMQLFLENLRKHAIEHRKHEALMNEISFLKEQLKPYKKIVEHVEENDELDLEM